MIVSSLSVFPVQSDSSQLIGYRSGRVKNTTVTETVKGKGSSSAQMLTESLGKVSLVRRCLGRLSVGTVEKRELSKWREKKLQTQI